MLKFCASPWNDIAITENGDVTPCICSAFHNKGPIGNLNYQSLTDIFNSTEMIKFRNTILDQTFSYCSRTQCQQFNRLPTVNNLDFVKSTNLPSTIMLAIDRNCNLRCSSCRSSNIYSKEPNENTLKILNQLTYSYQDHPTPVQLYLDGAGDIFASAAYQLFLRNNIPSCFKLVITTNGNLLLKNLDIIKKLKPQIDLITVSLDAATPSTYKEVRGGDFEIVINGIKEVVAMGIQVSSHFVVQQKNYKEIIEYIKLSKEFGVSPFGLSPIRRWSHMTDTWWAENKLENNSSIDYQFLYDSVEYIQKHDVDFAHYIKTQLH
jgi:MoaA/NifB/PqqE/SkfB family radical SAM enzyme